MEYCPIEKRLQEMDAGWRWPVASGARQRRSCVTPPAITTWYTNRWRSQGMPNVTSAPVRLKDIARELNVSVMTVSKVVRGCAEVGAETRSRVLAKI